jgi:putative FmdB family regulatory protein
VPTYQYACTECGDTFEEHQSFTDDALTECPTCGGRLRKVFNGVGIIFKGSGFYRTDSREAAKKDAKKDDKKKDDKKKDGAAAAQAKDSSSAKDGSSGKDKKADSKPAASTPSTSGNSSSSGSSSRPGSAA